MREGHSFSTIPPAFPEQTKMYEAFESMDGWDFPSGPVVKTSPSMGGGFRMGNTCKSMADSCQCMAKTTTILQSN